MDEKQFKILTEQLDEIVKHLAKLSRLAVDAKYDKKVITHEYDD